MSGEAMPTALGGRLVRAALLVAACGAVVAVFYVLAYVGFASPYLVEGLNSALGRRGTFAAIAAAALLIAGSLGLYSGSAPAVGGQ